MRIVIGFMWRRDVFKIEDLYIFYKDLDDPNQKAKNLGKNATCPYDCFGCSWEVAECLKYVCELNKPELAGCHRSIVWVKKRVFNTLEEAKKYAHNLVDKAREYLKQKENKELEAEILS